MRDELSLTDVVREFTLQVAFECYADDDGKLHWRLAVPRCYICDCETAIGTIERSLCEYCTIRMGRGAVLYLSGLARTPFLYVEPEPAWRYC